MMNNETIEDLVLLIDGFVEGIEEDYPLELIREALLEYVEVLDEVL